MADGCGFKVALRNDGRVFRVALRRCGQWMWPYLPISHNAVMCLYLHIHKNQQQLLHE